MPEQRLLPTRHGDARLLTWPASSPRLALLLQPGASGSLTARDLTGLTAALPAAGVTTMLLQPPFAVAGRRLAGRPAHLDEGLADVLAPVRAAGDQDLPLVLGGRSAGARSSCRSAGALGAAGCLALAFPLHPPGRPEKSRVEELLGSSVPTLVVQGARDPFGGPEEFPELDMRTSKIELVVVPDADHGFGVPSAATLTQRATIDLVVDAVLAWLDRLPGNQP